MLMALLAAAHLASPQCDWIRARYELVGDRGVTLAVVRRPAVAKAVGFGDTALRIAATGSSKVAWFVPTMGSSGVLTLVAIMNPATRPWREEPDAASFTAGVYDPGLHDANNEALLDIAGQAVPLIAIPGIASYWHDVFDRDGIGGTMFRLKACQAR
jgi:hypothetical protein